MRNLKKILALVLALVMSLSLMAVASADDELNLGDVSDVYAESVDVLTGLKVFQGNKGEFLPKTNITRAEVAAIIYRIVTGDVSDTQKSIYADYNKFSDVPSDAWYAGYVNYCANAEYVKGVGGGKFAPQQNVTGYEALAMILRAIGYDKNNEFTGSNWQIQTAATARNRGLLVNIAEGTLGGAATREVVAEILCKTILVPVADYSLAFGYRTTDANGKDNETLAYKTFKMEKINGVVTANEYADLESATPVGAGQTTLKLDGGEKRTMNVASNLDDLGESRYVYVIPQSGTTRYNLVCSKVYDTGKNNVYDSGDAVTTISNSTVKDSGINDISSAVYLRNYGELTSDVSDWRIEYVLRVHMSTYEAMSMYRTNGTAETSQLKKWNTATNDFDISIDFPNQNEYDGRRNIDNNTTKLTVANGAVDANGNWSHVDGTAATNNFTYEYRKVIPMGSTITAADKENIKTIFTSSTHLTSNDYDIGEVYVGTSTIAGQDDISNRNNRNGVSYAEFVEKYLKGKENTFTSNGLGNRLKVVDNNNDGVAEYILQTVYTVAIVSNVDANGKISLDIMNADFDALSDNCHRNTLHTVNPYRHEVDSCNEITSTTKTAIYGDGEVSTGTVVLYAYIDGTAQMEPAAGETAKFDKVVRTDRTATTTDDVEYKESAVHEHSSSLTHTVANLVTNTTYTVYFDKYGNLAAFTEGANGEFTLITDGWYNNQKAGAEYAARIYNDETASLETVDITSGGPLFIGNDWSNNAWGNLRYFDRLNDDGKTVTGGVPNYNTDDIHTTVAVLENGVLTPVDKVYRYNKQNAMIEMDGKVIPGRDNQTASVGYIHNTEYVDNVAYARRATGTVPVRGLSTTTYYFVYNFQSLAGTAAGQRQVSQVVRSYTGYAGLPSVPNALIEDVYAVGTRAVAADGSTYYTADVVVVELTDDYMGYNKSSEQVFIPQFGTVSDEIGIDYIDMIRGTTGEVENVRVNMRASQLRWYDEAGNIVNTRTSYGIVPGLYYMDKNQNTEDEYVIRYMTRDDIRNSGKYAVGYINKAAASDPANWTGVDRYVFDTTDTTSGVGDLINFNSEYARITNGVGHYYTLSYDAAGVAHLTEDRNTVLEQNPSKDATVLDTVNTWANETEYGTKPHRNEVLMAYSGSNVVFMVSFNEYQNAARLTRDHAQNVWLSLMPTSYTADSNTSAPSLEFYGYPVTSNPFNVSYKDAVGKPQTIVVKPGNSNPNFFDDNAINSVYVDGVLLTKDNATKNSDGSWTYSIAPIDTTVKQWIVEVSYNNGAKIDRYTLNRTVASDTAVLTSTLAGTVTQPDSTATPPVLHGTITIPGQDGPINAFLKTFSISDNASVKWSIVLGATETEITADSIADAIAKVGDHNTDEIVSITAVVTAENGTDTTTYMGSKAGVTATQLETAKTQVANALDQALTQGRSEAEKEQIRQSAEYKALMSKISSAMSIKALQSFATVTVTPEVRDEETGEVTTPATVTVGGIKTDNEEIQDVIDKAEEIAPAPATELPEPVVVGNVVTYNLQKDTIIENDYIYDDENKTVINLNGHDLSVDGGSDGYAAIYGGAGVTINGNGTETLTLKSKTNGITIGWGQSEVSINGVKMVFDSSAADAEAETTAIQIAEDSVNSTLTISNSSITSDSYAISVNGNLGKTATAGCATIKLDKVDITGGAYTAVYLAGNNNTKMTNCNVTSGASSAVEVRAGNLEVTGGSLTSTAAFADESSGSGPETAGVALAVAEHQTGNETHVNTVKVTGATLSGARAVLVKDSSNVALNTAAVTLSGCTTTDSILVTTDRITTTVDGVKVDPVTTPVTA